MESPFKILHREIYPAGTTIFREGEAGNRAYVIESGKVEVWREVGGEPVRLGLVGQGGIFGEMALIDKAPRMASVSALKDTTCVIVTEDVFNKKLDEADTFLVALLRIFVRNIRSLTDLQHLVEAGPKDQSDAPPAAPKPESEQQAWMGWTTPGLSPGCRPARCW